jgi:hypothetical protein
MKTKKTYYFFAHNGKEYVITDKVLCSQLWRAFVHRDSVEIPTTNKKSNNH